MPDSQLENRLLASLAPGDLSLLRPHLTRVRLNQSDVLQEANRPIEQIFFPLEGMVSVVAKLPAGEEIEIAAIGAEGAIGTKVGLHPQYAFAKAIVQLPGTALKIDLKTFQNIAMRNVALTHIATCANDLMIANLQQSAACNAIHAAEARLARWLLHARDRFSDDDLPLTQEFLAQMLGVRRTTVTLTAQALQNIGVLRTHRGRIEILDRKGLERFSCACYDVVRTNVGLILESAQQAKNV